MIVRTNREHSRQSKLQFLARHGLKAHTEVERRDGQLRDLLKRLDQCLLRDANAIDTCAGDGEVGVGFGDMVPQHDGGIAVGVVV